MNLNELKLEDKIVKMNGLQKLLPHQVVSLSIEVYDYCFKEENLENKNNILNIYKESVRKWNFDNIRDIQADYAIAIMSSKNELIFEELYKIYSLLDEIYILELLGFKLSLEKNRKLMSVTKNTLNKYKSLAKIVSNLNYEKWKSELWWYKEYIST